MPRIRAAVLIGKLPGFGIIIEVFRSDDESSKIVEVGRGGPGDEVNHRQCKIPDMGFPDLSSA